MVSKDIFSLLLLFKFEDEKTNDGKNKIFCGLAFPLTPYPIYLI